MSGQLIEYTIQNKKAFAAGFLEGSLDSISQKNTVGFTVHHIEDKFDMFLKLRSQSIVYLIEVSLINTRMITIELYDKENNIIEKVTEKNKTGFDVSLI